MNMLDDPKQPDFVRELRSKHFNWNTSPSAPLRRYRRLWHPASGLGDLVLTPVELEATSPSLCVVEVQVRNYQWYAVRYRNTTPHRGTAARARISDEDEDNERATAMVCMPRARSAITSTLDFKVCLTRVADHGSYLNLKFKLSKMI